MLLILAAPPAVINDLSVIIDQSLMVSGIGLISDLLDGCGSVNLEVAF